MRDLSTKILYFIYGVVLLLLLIDSYRSPGTVERLLFFSSRTYMSLGLIFVLLLYIKNFKFPELLKRVNNFFVFPASFTLVVLFTFIDYLTHVNYIYSLTHINYISLFYVELFSGILAFFFIDKKSLFKRVNFISLVISVFVIATAFVASHWPLSGFEILSSEDNLIENFQAVILLAASTLGILIFLFSKKDKGKIKYLFLILGVGLFFVAGDEISWGQRIIGFESHEILLEYNLQEETTIHNIGALNLTVPVGYMVIGLWGMAGWVIAKFSNLKKGKLRLYSSPYLFLFFLLPFVYNFYTSLGEHNIGIWSEFCELMLYLGVFFFVLENYIRIKTKNKD